MTDSNYQTQMTGSKMSKRDEGVNNCVIAGFKYAVPSEHSVAAQAKGSQLSHVSDRRVKSSVRGRRSCSPGQSDGSAYKPEV